MAAPDDDARRYHRWQFRLSVADYLLTAAVLAGWLWSGAALELRSGLERLSGSPWLQVAGLFLAIGGSATLVTLPFDVLQGYLLPRRFGLSHQPFGAWCRDRAKALALGGGLGLLAFEVLYACLRLTPWWWLLAAAIVFGGSLILAAVVPIWIVPLFYRLAPLEDTALRERLLTLARRIGVPVVEVAVADLSRKGRAANAAVVGLGRTRRILVSDTLLREFTPEEVEVILAHELGHHARRHLARTLVVQGALILGALGLADLGLQAWWRAAGFAAPSDPAGLPLLALLLLGLGLAASPLAAAWSRRLERDADRFALDVTGAHEPFVSAMERLGALNLAERRPHPVKEFLFATHPALERRIAEARARQAALGAA
ncbi:MAG: M48 family metalloprotease [Candidatus Rokubacteria bacterium]|nr:M48 family metalloprotease [Candidatus Rokubacteria bacterium]